MTNRDLIETLGDAVHYCEKAMESAEIYFGHGIDNAWDEAVALVLAVADLAPGTMGMGDRVSAYHSDLFNQVQDIQYDLILSNPPYVDTQNLQSMPAEYHREPELALGSGPDGLTLTRKILARAGRHLKPSGMLVLEVGNSWEALELAYPSVPFT